MWTGLTNLLESRSSKVARSCHHLSPKHKFTREAFYKRMFVIQVRGSEAKGGVLTER
jgi:hypothetical protein